MKRALNLLFVSLILTEADQLSGASYADSSATPNTVTGYNYSPPIDGKAVKVVVTSGANTANRAGADSPLFLLQEAQREEEEEAKKRAIQERQEEVPLGSSVHVGVPLVHVESVNSEFDAEEEEEMECLGYDNDRVLEVIDQEVEFEELLGAFNNLNVREGVDEKVNQPNQPNQHNQTNQTINHTIDHTIAYDEYQQFLNLPRREQLLATLNHLSSISPGRSLSLLSPFERLFTLARMIRRVDGGGKAYPSVEFLKSDSLLRSVLHRFEGESDVMMVAELLLLQGRPNLARDLLLNSTVPRAQSTALPRPLQFMLYELHYPEAQRSPNDLVMRAASLGCTRLVEFLLPYASMSESEQSLLKEF